jgi:hypothetical protein
LVGWAALMIIVAVAAGGTYWARDRIVEAWPPAARLFALLDPALQPANALGLELREVAARFEQDDGTPVLVVSGKVASVAKDAVAVPAIRINLFDKDDKAVFHWTFDVDTPMLGAGKAVNFSTRLPNPPAQVAGLEATFETRPEM